MKLNKINSLIGLCVATAAVSCSDALVDDVNKHPVGGEASDMISFVVTNDYTRGGSFGNRPELSTRASITSSKEDMQKLPFAVYGDMNNVVLFNGTEVSHGSSGWTYSNTQYWFEGEYSFVAIHPAKANSNLEYSDGKLSLRYTSPYQYEDIMTATHRRVYTSGSVTPVYFEFNHIFSRINFIAKVDPTSQSQFKITRLALKNVATQASFEITPASTTSQTKDFSGGWQEINDSDKNQVLFDNQYNGTNGTIDSKNSFEFFPNDNALLIIPQGVSTDVELEITYKSLTDSDQSEKTVYSKLFATTVTAHNGIWAAGQSYTYIFTLGENESIIFNAPVVQAWSEAEGGNYVITD